MHARDRAQIPGEPLHSTSWSCFLPTSGMKAAILLPLPNQQPALGGTDCFMSTPAEGAMLMAEDSLWLRVHNISTCTKGKGFFCLPCTRQQHHSTDPTLDHGHRIQCAQSAEDKVHLSYQTALKPLVKNCYRPEHGGRAALHLSRLICENQDVLPSLHSMSKVCL